MECKAWSNSIIGELLDLTICLNYLQRLLGTALKFQGPEVGTPNDSAVLLQATPQ